MVLANILSSLEHFYGLLGKNNGKRVTILCDDVLVHVCSFNVVSESVK